MHLGLISVTVAVVVSHVQAASLRFHRSQTLRTVERLCATAQRHAVDARELVDVGVSETVFPQQTVLGRCDPDEDCCEANSARRPVASDAKAVTFLIQDAVNKERQRYINVTVQDHVHCECVDVDQVNIIPEVVEAVVESRR